MRCSGVINAWGAYANAHGHIPIYSDGNANKHGRVLVFYRNKTSTYTSPAFLLEYKFFWKTDDQDCEFPHEIEYNKYFVAKQDEKHLSSFTKSNSRM